MSDSETGLEVWCDGDVRRIAVEGAEIRVLHAIGELLVRGLEGCGYSVLYPAAAGSPEIVVSEGVWTYSLARLDRLAELKRRLER